MVVGSEICSFSKTVKTWMILNESFTSLLIVEDAMSHPTVLQNVIKPL